MFNKIYTNQIATAIAIIFHTVGFAGIIFFKSDYIISLTSINILLMFALLIWTQPQKNIFFGYFVFFTIIAGLIVEMIGVKTKYIFGNYNYGNILGVKINNVPLIIGINWFIIIYCCGNFIQTILKNFSNKTIAAPVKTVLTIVDGATVAVFFDWLMEPVATKLGFWKWENNIPLYNYLCWFIVSMLLLYIFEQLKFNKQNKFAVHLLMIQAMFFLLLKIYFKG